MQNKIRELETESVANVKKIKEMERKIADLQASPLKSTLPLPLCQLSLGKESRF